MEDIIKSSVESRKSALLNAYQIADKDLLEEINLFFKEVENLANSCSDYTEFETKFAEDYQKEYTDLFVKAMNSNKTEEEKEKEKDSIAKDIASEAIDDVVMAGRRKAYQETYDKARDIPVVGDVLNVKQHFDFFSRFKKNKDK